MKTLTDLQLYKLAYDSLLQRYYNEQEINERTVKEIGRENSISKYHMEQMEPQMQELHDLILEQEKEDK